MAENPHANDDESEREREKETELKLLEFTLKIKVRVFDLPGVSRAPATHVRQSQFECNLILS